MLRIAGETAGPIGLKFYVDIFFQNFFSSNFCFNGKRRPFSKFNNKKEKTKQFSSFSFTDAYKYVRILIFTALRSLFPRPS